MSRIDRTAELAALTTCARKVLAATNGHHVRWARVGCTMALMNAGHRMESAEALAGSMTNFSTKFADRADLMHAEFNRGAIA